MNYDWNFARLAPYADAFLAGSMTTLVLTGLVICFGTLLGLAMGLIMRNKILRLLFWPLTDIFRAVPALVTILFCYYLFTVQVIGTTLEAFWVCVIALSMNLAAFTSELVRSAIDNIEAEIVDAARALGMSRNQTTRYIILPHGFRQIIPAMTVLYIGMLKLSSLASVVNVREVVYTAETVIADISRSLEAWAIVALVYIVIVVPCTYGARRLEVWARHGANVNMPQ